MLRANLHIVRLYLLNIYFNSMWMILVRKPNLTSYLHSQKRTEPRVNTRSRSLLFIVFPSFTFLLYDFFKNFPFSLFPLFFSLQGRGGGWGGNTYFLALREIFLVESCVRLCTEPWFLYFMVAQFTMRTHG